MNTKPPDDSFGAFIRSPAGIALVLGFCAFIMLVAFIALAFMGGIESSDDLPIIPKVMIIDGHPYIF